MGTPVLECNDLAIFRACHHDGPRAHHGGAVIPDFRRVDLQTEIVPGPAFERTRLFIARGFGIAVDSVRDPDKSRRPGACG
jgi:hypothetical protein